MAIINYSKLILDQLVTNISSVMAGSVYNFTIKTCQKPFKNYIDWTQTEMPAVIVQTIGDERYSYHGYIQERVIQVLPFVLYGTIEERNSHKIEDDIELFKYDLETIINVNQSLNDCISPGRVLYVHINRATRAIGKAEVEKMTTRKAWQRGLLVMTGEVSYSGNLITTV